MTASSTTSASVSAQKIAAVRQHVLGQVGHSDPTLFLHDAWAYLDAVSSDPEMAAAVIEALVRLGLGGPARELLKLRGDVPAGYAARIAEVPPGRVPWEELTATFEQNWAVVVQCHPYLAPHRKELEQARRRAHLYRMVTGDYVLSRRVPGRLRTWVDGLGAASVQATMPLPDLSACACVVVDGLAAGILVRRVYDAIGNAGPPVFLVEPDAAAVVAWLATADWRDVLADERVRVFGGASGDSDMETVLEDTGGAEFSQGTAITQPGRNPRTAHFEALATRLQVNRELTHAPDRRGGAPRTVSTTPDVAVVHEQMQERFARNLDACRRHRPEVHQALVAAEPSQRHRCIGLPCGSLTVCCSSAEGHETILGARQDPSSEATEILAQSADVIATHQPLLLAGMGNGYVLGGLQHSVTDHPLGLHPVCYVVEPDLDIVRQCLMIHDYTGPRGPIEHDHYRWFIGPGCAQELQAQLAAQPFLADPARIIGQSLDGRTLSRTISQMIVERRAATERAGRAIHELYEQHTRDHLLDVLGPTPSRPPRVLLLTSRFTTVLQYSTRDVAAALAELGWETEVLIEPAPYLRTTAYAIRQALLENRPDVVFMIDHLRYEGQGLLPPSLPVVSWIQDHLGNLVTAEAGAAIGVRDFVIGGWVKQYVIEHGYPDRQCIEIPRATRVPVRPTTWSSTGADLLYVSNHSDLAEKRIEDVVSHLGRSPAVQQLIRVSAAQLLELYQQGKAVTTQSEVRRIIEDSAAEMGAVQGAGNEFGRLAFQLFDRVNNVLYRQQSLSWVAEIAGDLGLELAIYGHGWDNHPRFAPYARGYAAYGPDLEDLTRRSKINLLLEPYFPTAHQRLLDSLVAGGFMLIRERPIDRVVDAWQHFLECELDPHVDSLATARAVLTAEKRCLLNEMHADLLADQSWTQADLVATYRRKEAEGLGFLTRLPPAYDVVAFADPATLRQKIEQFVAEPDARGRAAEVQRRFVEQHFSYREIMRRVVALMRERIAEEQLPRGVTD